MALSPVTIEFYDNSDTLLTYREVDPGGGPDIDVPASVVVVNERIKALLDSSGECGAWNYWKNPSTLSKHGHGRFLCWDKSARAIGGRVVSDPMSVKFIDSRHADDAIKPENDLNFKCYVKAIRPIITKGNQELYAVELVDERYRMKMSPCGTDKVFNVHDQGADAYYESTTNAGVPWTWDEVVDAIYADMMAGMNGPSSRPGWPTGFVPDGTPRNIYAANQNAAKILDDIAEFFGLHWVYWPYANVVDNYDLLIVAQDEGAKTAWESERELSDLHNVAGDLGDLDDLPLHVPGKISVAFPVRFKNSETIWSLASPHAIPVAPHHVVEATTTAPSVSDPEQHLIVYDSLFAQKQSHLGTTPGDVVNLAELQSRADFIADQLWAYFDNDLPGRRVDSGFHKYTLTGVTHCVTWQLKSDGPYTIVESGEGPDRVVPAWLRVPDTMFYGIDGVQVSPIGTGRWMISGGIPRLIHVDPPSEVCPSC